MEEEGDTRSNQQDTETYTSIKSILRPIIFCMKLFGLYHRRNDKTQTTAGTSGWKSKCTKVSASRVYCAVITFMLVLNIIKCIPSFWVGLDFVDKLHTIRVIIMGWSTQCGLNAVIMFLSCYKTDHIETFFEFYDKIATDIIATNLSLRRNCSELKYRVKIWTCIAIAFVSLNEIGIVFIEFSDLYPDMSVVLTSPFSQHLSAKILVAFIYLYCTASYTFPVCFFITVCSILRCQLGTLNERLRQVLDEKGADAVTILNDVLTKHNQYTKAIKRMDEYMGKLLLGVFSTGICTACFILYQLIDDSSLTVMGVIVYVFWIFANIVVLASSSVEAARVNSQAHSSLDTLYDMDLSEVNLEQLGNLNLFLSKLNGSAIGFTTMDLITITKEFLLTLLGVFATYFFLLLQFKV